MHRTVEGRVAGQGALDPPERLVEPAVVGQGAGDVGVHREVVRVVLDGAAQRGERLPGSPEPHLAHLRRRRPYSPAGPADRERHLLHPPGQRGRRAQQQRVLRVDGDRVAGERQVRRQGGPVRWRDRVGHGGADLHQHPGGLLGSETLGQLWRGHPGHARPVRPRCVGGGCDQQIEALGGGGQPGEGLVHLGQRRCPGQRRRDVVGGMRQLAGIQGPPGQDQFLRRRQRPVVRSLGHVVLSLVGPGCAVRSGQRR